MVKRDMYEILSKKARELNNPYLALQLAHQSAAQQYKEAQEREQLKKEITAEVLSNIAVSVDTKDAIMQIKELNKAINSLGK